VREKKKEMRLVNFALVVSLVMCTPKQQANFAEAAELVCDGLEQYEHLHNEILSIHMLIERGDYDAALKVAYALTAGLEETGERTGSDEVKALTLLLESIVKGQHDLPH
jgi:hypothetical protein